MLCKLLVEREFDTPGSMCHVKRCLFALSFIARRDCKEGGIHSHSRSPPCRINVLLYRPTFLLIVLRKKKGNMQGKMNGIKAGVVQKQTSYELSFFFSILLL